MDTDDLSIQTYQGVLAEAEKVDPDLTLQFGLLANNCLTENEFLQKSIELIKVLKKYTKEELSDVFYGKIPDLKSFNKALEIISNNIERIKTFTAGGHNI